MFHRKSKSNIQYKMYNKIVTLHSSITGLSATPGKNTFITKVLWSRVGTPVACMSLFKSDISVWSSAKADGKIWLIMNISPLELTKKSQESISKWTEWIKT